MRAGSVIVSGVRHATSIGLQALLVVAIVVALIVAVATAMGQAPGGADKVFAAKGGKGSTAAAAGSFIRLDQAGDTLMIGSKVTFTSDAVGLIGNEYALVYLKCMQGDDVVYGQLDGPDTTFVLGAGSSPWRTVGGKATCVGYLKAYGSRGGDTIRTLAATESFSAD